MRRRFREVSIKEEKGEKINKKKEEFPAFINIKPETNITFQEACDIINSLFSEEIEEEVMK